MLAFLCNYYDNDNDSHEYEIVLSCKVSLGKEYNIILVSIIIIILGICMRIMPHARCIYTMYKYWLEKINNSKTQYEKPVKSLI